MSALPPKADMCSALGDVLRAKSGHSGLRGGVYATAIGEVVRTRLRFAFPHVCMWGREKSGFRIFCRDPDVARAELGASVWRMTDKPGDRRHRNYAVVQST